MARKRPVGIEDVEKLRRQADRALSMKSPQARLKRLERCLESTLECLGRQRRYFQERVKDLRLVFDINRKMTELLDPALLLPQIVDCVAERLDVERVSIMLMDESRQYLHVKIGKGFDRPIQDIPATRSGRESPARWLPRDAPF